MDYAPEELYAQVPFTVELDRELPGDDRTDYWIAALVKPLRWIQRNQEVSVTHLIISARWQGTAIQPGVKHLPIGIAYVTDSSVLVDSRLSFSKCEYVAIGVCYDSSKGRRVGSLNQIIAGTIGKLFGRGGGTSGT